MTLALQRLRENNWEWTRGSGVVAPSRRRPTGVRGRSLQRWGDFPFFFQKNK